MKHLAFVQHLLLVLFALTLASWRNVTAQQVGSPTDARETEATNKEKRTALVISDSRYANYSLLQPLNDARAVAAELRELEFEVLTGENLSQSEWRRLLRTFGERARGGAVSLFYFAGVGAQADGVNYLIPGRAKIKRRADVRREAIALNDVLTQMKAAGARANLVLLDACRVHPSPAVRRVLTSGLAEIKAPSDTLISYAAQPGKTERAQPGRSSFYTASLLQHLRTPGLTLADLFQRVRAGVEELTQRKQSPWMTSTIAGDFYFVPVRQVAIDNTVALLDDVSTWKTIAGSTDPQDFQAFLAKFPNSAYAEAAQMKLRQLTAKTEPVVELQQSLPEEFSAPSSTQTAGPPPKHEINLATTAPPAPFNERLTLAARAELERAFYVACYDQKNEALCCQLSRELMTKFPGSGLATAAANKARTCEVVAPWEQFKQALDEYYRGPDQLKLEKLFATGEAFLKIQPDYPYVVAQIMFAGASAVLGEVYRDRDRVKVYVERALRLFESNAKFSDEEQLKQWSQFRADVLAAGYQYLGYYYSLSNAEGAQERALAYLNKAVQIKEKPNIGWRDPNNYWLRATVRNNEYVKLSREYMALTEEQKISAAGKELLAKINAVIDLLIADYARTVAVATNPAYKGLQDAAQESLTALWKYRHDGSLAGMEEFIKRYANDPSAP